MRRSHLPRALSRLATLAGDSCALPQGRARECKGCRLEDTVPSNVCQWGHAWHGGEKKVCWVWRLVGELDGVVGRPQTPETDLVAFFPFFCPVNLVGCSAPVQSRHRAICLLVVGVLCCAVRSCISPRAVSCVALWWALSKAQHLTCTWIKLA